MIALGARIAKGLPAGAVVLMNGNLGAGKTTLAKGIVKGLGAAEESEVSSPTFTLIQEYGSPVRVYHIDLYRLDEARELATLGLEEVFDSGAVVLVEWADKFPAFMPENAMTIEIERRGEDRVVTLTGFKGPII